MSSESRDVAAALFLVMSIAVDIVTPAPSKNLYLIMIDKKFLEMYPTTSYSLLMTGNPL